MGWYDWALVRKVSHMSDLFWVEFGNEGIEIIFAMDGEESGEKLCKRSVGG